MKKKVFYGWKLKGILLAALLALALPGTAAATIEIYTLDQLQHISDNLTAQYVLMNDIDASATRTWNGGAGFAPIGTNTYSNYSYPNSFMGRLDGGGHVIRNLYINRPAQDYVGLFGFIYQGQYIPVSNLGLDNVTAIGGNYVGALAGFLEFNYNYAHQQVNSCYSTGSVTGTSSVGGLMGLADRDSYMTTSYSRCAVTGTDKVGGVVGYNGLIMTYSYSMGPVTGSTNVGGMEGYAFPRYASSAYYCFWDIETSGRTSNAAYYNATGKTTAEMMTQSTFTDAGWDFTNTWCMVDNATYPQLQWRAASISLKDNSYGTQQDTALAVPAPGVLDNDSDSAGGALAAVLVQGTAHGTLHLSDNGSFTYTPEPGYAGTDSFTYTTPNSCATAVVTITVNADTSPCPAPNLTAPSGAATSKPAFSWTKADDGAWYNIMVWSEARGGIVANPWFGPTSCSGNTCTAAQLGTALPAGNNWWWLNVYYGDTACGFVEQPGGKWKLAVVGGCTTPPVLSQPDSAVITTGTKPTFIFSDTGAEWYNVNVWTSAGYLALNQWEDATVKCSAGTCTIISNSSFGAGTTNWWWLNTYSDSCGFQMQPGGLWKSFTVQ